MRRNPRRTGRATTLLAAALVAPMITAAPATAAGPLPSTTTLIAAPASSTVGTPVSLRAIVRVLGLPGLGITPTGPVSFTATNGTATAALGSARLGPCLLTACMATLTTASLPVGTTSVRATYRGDTLVSASSDTARVTVAPDPDPGTDATVTCYAGDPCDSGLVTGVSTTLRVVAEPSAGNQTLTASLEHGGQLHCVLRRPSYGDDYGSDQGVPFTGDLATFSSTAPDAAKTADYTGSGQVGAEMLRQYSEAKTLFAGCFGAPHPFLGYVGGVYTDAVFVPADGLFEAQLSNCANNSGQRPCFTNIQGRGTTDTYRVRTQPGDPKFIG
jgi:hypothetical protein